MPANLTQQYLKAEEEYRRAATTEEELACLQVMLKEIPKHKGTDHLQADLKTKIAKLKKDLVAEKSGKKRRPRSSHPAAGGRHGNPPGRPQRRQEPTDLQPHPGDARGRPLPFHHPYAGPGHDALRGRDGPIDRHAAGHQGFHGPAHSRPDPFGGPGPLDGRPGQRRRRGAVPGSARSAERHQDPPGGAVVPR